MDIRMIASDIDDTILPKGAKISEATRKAVDQLKKRNIDFVISSGRWFIPARKVALEAGIEEGYMIIASGGAVVDINGVPLKEWTMHPDDVRKAYDIMRRYNVLINSFVRNALYQVNTYAMTNHAHDIREYYGDCCWISDDWALFESKGLENVYKMEAYTENAELLKEVGRALLDAGLHLSSSHAHNIEVVGENIGKGVALKWLAESKGISMDQVMAFGDNSNDMNMLSAVGWPVAVGNAIDEVRAAARIVGDSCANDGVAKVIEKYVLGGQEA